MIIPTLLITSSCITVKLIMCVCAKNACSSTSYANCCKMIAVTCLQVMDTNMCPCIGKKKGGAQNVINKAFQIHCQKPTVDYVLFLSLSSW